MKYFFLIAAFNALFFAALLVQKKTKAFHDRILIFWLLYLGFYTGIYGIFSPAMFTSWPLLSAAFISLLMLQGPFLYLYIQSLMNQTSKLLYTDLLHFIPFVLFISFLTVINLFPETAVKIRLDHLEGEHASASIFNFFRIT